MKYPAGTLNLVAIQDAIYDWVYSVTKGVLDSPEQIIWRNQSEPLPARPCVTLKFTYGPAPLHRDANVINNGANDPITAGMQMEATLSVQIFGNTKTHRPMANQLAVDLNSSLLRETVRYGLKRGGVSIYGVGKPSNLTALEESQYEERAGFELSLGMVQNVTDQPGTIEIVNLEKTVDGITTDQQITLP